MFIKKSEDTTTEDKNLFLVLTQQSLDQSLKGGVAATTTTTGGGTRTTPSVTTSSSKVLVLSYGVIDESDLCKNKAGPRNQGDQLSKLIKGQNIEGICGLKLYKAIADGYNSKSADWNEATVADADPDDLVVQGTILVGAKTFTVNIYSQGKNKPFQMKILEGTDVKFDTGEKDKWTGGVSTSEEYK